MDLVIYILVGIFIVVMAVKSVREDWSSRRKSIEQRREETYEQYVERMEEFRESEAKDGAASEKE